MAGRKRDPQTGRYVKKAAVPKAKKGKAAAVEYRPSSLEGRRKLCR